jgi:hypothetical protein
MHKQVSLEQRVAMIEDDLASLRLRLEAALPANGENWIERITGSMKDFPEFDEVVKLGAEIRRADQMHFDP